MGANYRKPVRGERFRPDAALQGDVIDVVQAFKQGFDGTGPRGRFAGSPPATLVRVQNNGTQRNRYEIVQLAGPPVIAPDAENELEFKETLLFNAATPDSDSKAWAVLTKDLPANEIGLAVVAGITQCRVTVDDEDDAFADIESGATLPTTRAVGGRAEILWKESGTGAKWAVLILGARTPAGVRRVALAQTGGSGGDEATAASWVYTVTDELTGIVLATGASPLVRRWPRAAAAASWGYADVAADGTVTLIEALEVIAIDTGCGGEE